MKHGYENGRIDVYLEERAGSLAISFDDDGPGVADCDRIRIFEPLARGRDAVAAGYGLGLAIVRATVERAGGEIDISRSSLGGARFTLDVPRVDGETDIVLSRTITSAVHDAITMRSS